MKSFIQFVCLFIFYAPNGKKNHRKWMVPLESMELPSEDDGSLVAFGVLLGNMALIATLSLVS